MASGKTTFVFNTYRVKENMQEKFVDLLERTQKVMEEENLVTHRKSIRMKSAKDPEILMEIFECSDRFAHERAHKNPKVANLWKELEGMCTEKNIALSELPEASEACAQFTAL